MRGGSLFQAKQVRYRRTGITAFEKRQRVCVVMTMEQHQCCLVCGCFLPQEYGEACPARCFLCMTCRRSEQFHLAQTQSQRVGLARLWGSDSDQRALAEIVRWRCWQVIS